LPEDEQTSKHGGGGRYNAILEFKRGGNLKKWERKEKEEKNEKEIERKRKNICMRKIKNVSMSKNKMNSPVL
jgi:hypothetical protein